MYQEFTMSSDAGQTNANQELIHMAKSRLTLRKMTKENADNCAHSSGGIELLTLLGTINFRTHPLNPNEHFKSAARKYTQTMRHRRSRALPAECQVSNQARGVRAKIFWLTGVEEAPEEESKCPKVSVVPHEEYVSTLLNSTWATGAEESGSARGRRGTALACPRVQSNHPLSLARYFNLAPNATEEIQNSGQASKKRSSLFVYVLRWSRTTGSVMRVSTALWTGTIQKLREISSTPRGSPGRRGSKKSNQKSAPYATKRPGHTVRAREKENQAGRTGEEGMWEWEWDWESEASVHSTPCERPRKAVVESEDGRRSPREKLDDSVSKLQVGLSDCSASGGSRTRPPAVRCFEMVLQEQSDFQASPSKSKFLLTMGMLEEAGPSFYGGAGVLFHKLQKKDLHASGGNRQRRIWVSYSRWKLGWLRRNEERREGMFGFNCPFTFEKAGN
ncbi:hypothetical protein B0H17DRAFT_1146517 [Mycena rosella]|uniref:Uncharacterized protein n=1 Tax=Mycena rosella TaxID=1033263 RepID=A0AAD7G4E2_MYCRO|nr:hypothetical protein B0H17DRAFT_1146517 [Mycena rosella]